MGASSHRELFLWIVLCSGAVFQLVHGQPLPAEGLDVKEGKALELRCKFNPALASRNILYFWVRTNTEGTENAAISGSALFPHYTVDFEPTEGRYDLLISRAQYEKDNGRFECRLKEAGSGLDVHSSGYQVTVLIPPGNPKISPGNPTAREGEALALTCASEGGSPDPEIQWYRDDVPVQSTLQPGGSRDKPTIAVLSLTPRQEDDGASFRCVVRSRAMEDGARHEARVTLRVYYAPKVTVGPFNPLHVMVGNDATLTCSVVANPPARSVRWMKRGQLLSNTPNHTIPGVTPEDSGTYSCVADNGVLQPTHSDLQLSVLYGPRVSVLPEQETSQGENVVIKCNIASNPEPHAVFWQREGDATFRQKGDTLRLERVTADDAATYVCEAAVHMRPSTSAVHTEVIGNDSVILHVRHKPGEAEITPNSPTAVAGRPFTLSCGARPPGWPRPEYRWWREGQEHIPLGHRANQSFLAIHNSHEGRYYCQPHNALGKGSIASVYMAVSEAATIVIPLRPQIVRKAGDQNQSITCRARGKPKPRVRWTHRDQDIDATTAGFSIKTVENVEDNEVFSSQSTLTFDHALTPEDRGKYACHFDNGFGGEAVSEMQLRIEHPPQVRHTYNRVAFDIGDTAVLRCKMQAYPEPSFEWMFKGRILERYANYATNITNLGDDLYAGTLSVSDIKESDYGDYTCRAWNQVGDVQRTILKLVKKSAPDRPARVQVVSVDSDKVTLQWLEGFSGGFANTEFVVTYTHVPSGHTKNESCRTLNPCSITGLDSKSEYVMKVVAVNPRGFSPYSEEITVQTKVNLKDMPRPLAAQYDRDSGTVYFNVDSSAERLVARVEGRLRGQEDWQPLAEMQVDRPQLSLELPENGPSADSYADIRVLLCLQSNISWCGDERLAEPFDEFMLTTETNSHPVGAPVSLMTMKIVIIVSVTAGLFFLLVVTFVCCCWKRKAQKVNKKDYESEVQNARPKVISAPYYHDDVSKGLDNNGDDLNKHGTNIYGTSMGSSHIMNGHNSGHPMQNGMMYGSGDMLDGAHPGDMGKGELWVKGGDMAPESSYQPYDSRPPPSSYYYPQDDYQGLNEDVMNMKNREHLHSPYYDVSGLPDPYATMGDEDKNPQISLSFDESLESGYSTPNSRSRRIVREIIV
ncbi:protein turtle homolog B-like [Ornithodoros turicata]|uniref:protein turtle homolog B-like n=1 Tax=Ornithodoros turicata TaxID=34597 RepID=UPI0031395A30